MLVVQASAVAVAVAVLLAQRTVAVEEEDSRRGFGVAERALASAVARRKEAHRRCQQREEKQTSTADNQQESNTLNELL